MSDKNFWDFMITLANSWSPWYTLIMVLAGLLAFGIINSNTITIWIKAASALVPHA